MPLLSDLVYRRVAEIHIEGIDRGFLTTLGVNVLSLLYRAIDEGPDSFLIIAIESGNVIGFVAGATGLRPIYRRMLRRWPSLLFALAPTLLSPRKIFRIWETIRYSRSGPVGTATPLPTAELLSIAVAREFRGKGHADRLYARLCAAFRDRGVKEFRIVVGDSLASAHKFYTRAGAKPAASVQVHGEQVSTVYIHSTE